MSTFDRTIELDVTGMTCGSCVANVREELAEVSGVANIDVILRPEGASLVTVVATKPLEDNVLEQAVTEAGYQVSAIRRDASLPIVAEETQGGSCGCGCGCK